MRSIITTVLHPLQIIVTVLSVGCRLLSQVTVRLSVQSPTKSFGRLSSDDLANLARLQRIAERKRRGWR
ncbi:hypothetical protein KKF05_00870 [Patescibacteria group bacterium]|nr:hypothetical protein [Patescibacteria group bacterium]MBU1029011.1 hypothetical protein [Patescibacteria group bacterium]MBU1915797.1 hypothetical protein [Patescibacteria group bacterium]